MNVLAGVFSVELATTHPTGSTFQAEQLTGRNTGSETKLR